MNLLQALIPAAALWCAQAAAETPRLSLWITDAIGASNAGQCAQPALHDYMQMKALRAKITQHIDDSDVASWNPATATWTLRDTGTPAKDRAWKIADRCFVLWIDGKPAAAGVALWTHSARLVSMPVLGVAVTGSALSLRLGANYGGPASLPVEHARISAALEGKPHSRDQVP